MRTIAYLPPTLLLIVCLSLGSSCQTQPAEIKTTPAIQTSGESVQNGIFHSVGGKFSIDIPELPHQTIDQGTDKANVKGIDAGKQYVWIFEKTLFTIFYDGPFDKDGNPYPQKFEDMEMGTRKGIFNGQATLLSEKPIQLGKHRGTEFRYMISNGVRYISRIFLIGDRGYQVVGGYADANEEKTILAVLDSFKPENR